MRGIPTDVHLALDIFQWHVPPAFAWSCAFNASRRDSNAVRKKRIVVSARSATGTVATSRSGSCIVPLKFLISLINSNIERWEKLSAPCRLVLRAAPPHRQESALARKDSCGSYKPWLVHRTSLSPQRFLENTSLGIGAVRMRPDILNYQTVTFARRRA